MSRAVQQMFDGIAPTYDTLNRVLSLGIDQSWRKKAVAALGHIHGRRVLDVCAGTLDLSLLAFDAGAEVVATDFSHAMLVGGRGKVLIPVVRADEKPTSRHMRSTSPRVAKRSIDSAR